MINRKQMAFKAIFDERKTGKKAIIKMANQLKGYKLRKIFVAWANLSEVNRF